MLSLHTWHTGNAEQVRVTDEEVLQDFAGLVGINHYDFGGGVCAGADPHQTGELVLLPQLLLLLLLNRPENNTLIRLGHLQHFFKIISTKSHFYLELLLQFVQATLRASCFSEARAAALYFGNISIKHARSYNRTPVTCLSS